MELRHLRYFLKVSEELHVTKAAEKLGIAQPTLSHQLKLLEKQLGYPLFERTGKAMKLTVAGEIVQQEALHIEQTLTRMHDRLTALKATAPDMLRVVVPPGELTELTAEVALAFHQHCPGTQLRIDSTVNSEAAILRREADIALSYTHKKHEQLTDYCLYEEPFYVISNKAPKAKTLKQICQQPLILFPLSYSCQQVLLQACKALHIARMPLIETASAATLLQFVQSGAGNSIVSETFKAYYTLPDLQAQRIESPSLTRHVTLLTHKQASISTAAQIFLALFIGKLKQMKINIDANVEKLLATTEL